MVPMPCTRTEMEFYELIDVMKGKASSFAARQEAAMGLNVMLAATRDDREALLLPENAVDAVVTSYLENALMAVDNKDQRFFVNCANDVLGSEKIHCQQHDLMNTVLAALPLCVPVKMDTGRSDLLDNIASVASTLPESIRYGQLRDALIVFQNDARVAVTKGPRFVPKAINKKAEYDLSYLIEGGANLLPPDPALN